ncbi:DNA-binding MarR family transcriptional regulator [Virgibacillus halotolerans]|uniref:MarR family winged helix-turn-helix transcriptional regulator n=1 Tax=Virgibacillus halotolerans TaxID=1071053 RepID=UPI0019620D38|nr:MarR family transcriptional regulator [Virgibacillus halotolerans]MBM7598836.1 DNA-binding MarR family transcriptional regulator [Virgibacillus halotolerans]
MDNLTNQNLIHMLNQQSRLLAKEVNQRLSDHGLYASQWSIIFCIDRFGPMTQTAIWKYLNVEAPTVTRTLSRMEKSGWIVRKQGNDKRERVIELTEEARQKFTPIRQTMDQFELEMLAGLSLEEKEQLQYLLSKIGTTGENA